MRKNMTESEKKFYIGNRLNRIMSIVSQLLSAILNIGFAFIMRFFIDAVELSNSNFMAQGSYIFLGYLMIYILFSLVNRKYSNTYIKQALSQFKNYVFEKVIDRPVSEYKKGTSAKFISAFSNDLTSIENNYLIGSNTIIWTGINFVAAALSLIWLCWYLSIPILLVTIICLLLSIKYGERLAEKEKTASWQNIGFISQIKDLLSGYLVIKSFKAEKEVLKLFMDKNRELEEAKLEKRATADMVTIYGVISSIVVNSVILGGGFLLAFKGIISVGKVMAMIQLANYIITPIRTLPSLISNRNAALGLICKIDKEVSYEKREKSGQLIEQFNQSICMKNISFSYNEGEKVLENINLMFEKGKSYVIVGASGSGKSTILKLLLGHEENYRGEITFDGIDISKIERSSLYDLVSIIQQDVFLFDSSIRNNITMFKDFEPEKINQATRNSGLEDLIRSKGEHYFCGEGGKNLSGGEKQRVSIARAFVRETPIILMDEATASLDNETAISVERTILEMEGKTKIVITHRFHESILRQFHEIIVLNNGKIVEKGSFKKLMEDKGYFYSLYLVSLAE